MALSRADRETLLSIARQTLQCIARGEPLPEPRVESAELRSPACAFVTLRRNRDLRGCIGCVQAARPLWQTVRDMTAQSATSDPRFPQVRPEEADELAVEISVLHPFTRVSSPQELVPRRHGVYVRNGSRSGLLLPQVIEMLGGRAEELVRQACKKAGLAEDAWRAGPTELFAFEATRFSQDPLPTVLFACVRNSCRSQMAEGLARSLGRGWLRPYSAGSQPAPCVNPTAVEVVREIGSDISAARPKGFAELPVRQADYLISMGCGEACPTFPARNRREWSIKDPEGEPIESFRLIRDQIAARIEELLSEIRTSYAHS